MNFFYHTRSDEYVKLLRSKLSIENLIATAIPLERNYKGRRYTKRCRIDYCGVTAASLLGDGGGELAIEELFKNVDQLNQVGVSVKIRLLFSYPYSAYFFSMIQAESAYYAPTLAEPENKPDYLNPERINDVRFKNSNIRIKQCNSLRRLESYILRYGWNVGRNRENNIVVRFTPFGPNVCSLIINDDCFFDAYHFTKESNKLNRLSLNGPVLHVENTREYHNKKLPPKESEDNSIFEKNRINFLYLWRHELTMDCEDATHFKSLGTEPGKLSEIKTPMEIEYNAKARRLANTRKKEQPSIDWDVKFNDWKIGAKYRLNVYTTETSPTPEREKLFIACSWDKNDNPNKDAQILCEWLSEDFKHINTLILKVTEGSIFDNTLNRELRDSTLAIIIQNSDIDGKNNRFYAKPNVYYEFGYFKRHFDSNLKSPIFVFSEEEVVVPSNASNIVRRNFKKNKIFLKYHYIINWLITNTGLNATNIDECITNYRTRLNSPEIRNQFNQEEYNQVHKEIETLIEELKAKDYLPKSKFLNF